MRHAKYSSLTITINGMRNICSTRPGVEFSVVRRMRGRMDMPLMLRKTSKVNSRSVGGTVGYNVTGVGVRARLYRTTVRTVGRRGSRPFLTMRHTIERTIGRHTVCGVGLFNSSKETSRWDKGRVEYFVSKHDDNECATTPNVGECF